MRMKWVIVLLLSLLLGACSTASQSAGTPLPQPTPTPSPASFPITETGLLYCYNFLGQSACPATGEVLFGQDASYFGAELQYSDNGDGSVTDAITGLTWQQLQSNTRVNQAEAVQACDVLELAGYDDWRLPSIQELFSIADLSGITGTEFFIDSNSFELRYARPEEKFPGGGSFDQAGQTWSATLGARGETAYIFNFFNGELRTYDVQESFFYRCVRGATYGENAFVENGDGMVTDKASGLTWQQADSQYELNWGGALAYCEDLDLADYDDWRLPDLKELASLALALDDSVLFPSSDPAGRLWSSTSRADTPAEAYYLCLGDCLTLQGEELGAGSLRSEVKYGNVEDYPVGEVALGIDNLVRCVRGGDRHPISGPYEVATDSTILVVDMGAAANLLGVDADMLLSALGSTSPSDPAVQKAAFSLDLDLDTLRATLQAHTAQATAAPST